MPKGSFLLPLKLESDFICYNFQGEGESNFYLYLFSPSPTWRKADEI